MGEPLEAVVELGEEFGRGGFGVVYRARARADGRALAVKIAHPETAALMRERILRETALLTGVRHPRLAALEGVCDDPERGLALLYQLVPGKPLPEARGPEAPDPRVFLAWLSDLAAGVEALHDAGIVHRDLKPENLVVEPSGQLRVLDFGIARGVEAGATVTATGMLVGTPGYLAPEVMLGERATPATDVYAAAAVLFWILEGRDPFPGSTPTEVLELQRARALPPLTAWGGDAHRLRPALLEALAPAAGDRPATMAALVTAVHAAFGRKTAAAATEILPSREDLPLPARTLDPADAATPLRAPGPPESAGNLRGPAVLVALLAVAALAGLGREAPPPALPSPATTGPPPPAPPPPRLPAGFAPDLPDRIRAELGAAQGVLVDERGALLSDAVPGEGTYELLHPDYLRWPYLVARLPALGEARAWLAGGGRADALPAAVQDALREVDAAFRDQALPAPFEPYLPRPAPPPLPGEFPPILRDLWREEGFGGELPDALSPPAAAAARSLAELHRLFLAKERELHEGRVEGFEEQIAASMLLTTSSGLVALGLNAAFLTEVRIELSRWFEDGRVALQRALLEVGRATRVDPEAAIPLALLTQVGLGRYWKAFYRTITSHEPVDALLGGPPGTGAATLALRAHLIERRFDILEPYRLGWVDPAETRAAWRAAADAAEGGTSRWGRLLEAATRYTLLQSLWGTPAMRELPEAYAGHGAQLEILDRERRVLVALQLVCMAVVRGEVAPLAPAEFRALIDLARDPMSARRLAQWSTTQMAHLRRLPREIESLDRLLAAAAALPERAGE